MLSRYICTYWSMITHMRKQSRVDWPVPCVNVTWGAHFKYSSPTCQPKLEHSNKRVTEISSNFFPLPTTPLNPFLSSLPLNLQLLTLLNHHSRTNRQWLAQSSSYPLSTPASFLAIKFQTATADPGLSYCQDLSIGKNSLFFMAKERRTVLFHYIKKSPVNTRVLELVAKRAAQRERTLIMVATPWEQL